MGTSVGAFLSLARARLLAWPSGTPGSSQRACSPPRPEEARPEVARPEVARMDGGWAQTWITFIPLPWAECASSPCSPLSRHDLADVAGERGRSDAAGLASRE